MLFRSVVVLSLFVPLCISTGGNSGSQAATLITRALALGEITRKDWFRIFKHEMMMGLALGATLGAIGLFRASLTPETVRDSSHPRHESFVVRTPVTKPLTLLEKGTYELPVGTVQRMLSEKSEKVRLPESMTSLNPKEESGELVYEFPESCTMLRPPVDRWDLALVIGFSDRKSTRLNSSH